MTFMHNFVYLVNIVTHYPATTDLSVATPQTVEAIAEPLERFLNAAIPG